MAETEARVIAHAWQARRLPPFKPLQRLTENPKDRNIGNPQEFENADAMLEAIGEGGEGEVGWRRTSEEKRRGRTEAMALRRKHLGY